MPGRFIQLGDLKRHTGGPAPGLVLMLDVEGRPHGDMGVSRAFSEPMDFWVLHRGGWRRSLGMLVSRP